MQLFECEQWYDGSSWRTQTPDFWRVSQNMTLKNYPYQFVSPTGTVLTVCTAKHVSSNRAAWQSPLPSNLTSPAERKAYQLAEGYGRSSSDLLKRNIGVLVGFTYSLKASVPGSWEGFFISEPWMIHARLELATPGGDGDGDKALQVLESLEFREAA